MVKGLIQVGTTQLWKHPTWFRILPCKWLHSRESAICVGWRER